MQRLNLRLLDVTYNKLSARAVAALEQCGRVQQGLRVITGEERCRTREHDDYYDYEYFRDGKYISSSDED